jgi:hypothetical protein
LHLPVCPAESVSRFPPYIFFEAANFSQNIYV